MAAPHATRSSSTWRRIRTRSTTWRPIPRRHGDLLLAMNEKLTRLIEDEVGEDRGQFLPENKAGWNVTTIDP